MSTNITQVIKNEPLFLGEFGTPATQHESIFFGLGLCTSKQPASAIPFDILSFFLTAESITRQLPNIRTIVLIADSHAQSNPFMTPRLVKTAKSKILGISQRIVNRLSLHNFSIICASQISSLLSFQETLSRLPAIENQYLRQEIADVKWLSRHERLIAKLGWSLDRKFEAKGHDERFFDLQIQRFLDSPLQFIHLEAGRTLDSKRPKASPYISTVAENRILLERGENVTQKLSCASRDARQHWTKIVLLFEKLFGPTQSNSLESKMQFIIDKIML